MKKVFLLAGQGCQFYHMGSFLYQNDYVFRKNMIDLDNLIKRITGESVAEKIYDTTKKQSESFISIRQTHLAIFMFEYAAAQTMISGGIKPDFVLGCSLGEICGLVIAGILDLEETLIMLSKQAWFIEGKVPKGGMLAVFDDSKIYFEYAEIFDGCKLVSVNHSRNFIVSGSEKRINSLMISLKQKKVLCDKLPVQYGFHSEEIECIKQDCYKLFSNMRIMKPGSKVLSCSLGGYLKNVDLDYLWNIIRGPIQLKQCINLIENEKCIFIDLSPDGEMRSILKYLLHQNNNIYGISSRFGCKEDTSEIISSIKSKEVKGMKAYVFPGQGSQEKGMGKDLFDEFYDLTKMADDILGYSIKDLCLNDSEGKLNQTEYTQPALFIVSAFSYLKKIKDGESEPDYLAGHSIGEYAALFAAEVIDFPTGVKLVKKRGELMARATGGGMAAVLGLTESQVRSVLENNDINEIDIANLNTATQIVISGLKQDILRAKSIFENTDGCLKFVELKVSGAFHSRYMKNAMDEFTDYLNQFTFGKFKIPVISNVYARPYKQSEFLSTLSKQIVSSVQWTDSIRYLMGKGVEDITQLGPGYVAQNLVKKIKKESQPLYIEDEIEDVVKTDVITQESNQNSLNGEILPEMLGNSEFLKEYNLKYAYIMGGMYRGISGERLVIKAGKAGFMAFYGVGGLQISQVETAIKNIQKELSNGEPYGFNFLADLRNPNRENQMVDIYLKYGVGTIEAAAFISISEAIVKYRVKGIHLNEKGEVVIPNRIIAKVSRPEVAEYFMSPPPSHLVEKLLCKGDITKEEADLSAKIPMSYDITVEADSAGHTDGGNAYTLMPSIISLHDEMMRKYKYSCKIRIGAAGGIGTPNAAAAAFMLGADYIVTGSINQCTVEADTSDEVKEMLNEINVQDTDYAPAGDMFELGSKVQVLKKGTLFSVRGNKLYSLYTNCKSIEEIDEKTRYKIERNYFNQSLEDVYKEIEKNYGSDIIKTANENPKMKMGLIFRRYFSYSTRSALKGESENRSNYQIQCGPAMGAFNQFVKGTRMEDWKNRHVDEIGILLINETAKYLNNYVKNLKRVGKYE